MIQEQYYTQLSEAKKYTSFETNFIQLPTGIISIFGLQTWKLTRVARVAYKNDIHTSARYICAHIGICHFKRALQNSPTDTLSSKLGPTVTLQATFLDFFPEIAVTVPKIYG